MPVVVLVRAAVRCVVLFLHSLCRGRSFSWLPRCARAVSCCRRALPPTFVLSVVLLHGLCRGRSSRSRPRCARSAPGDKFCQRATKQPISHRGSWGAQTGPGTFRRQLISIIMNYNQPWTTLGLAPQPQRENRDPNGSQGSANFHCIMVPGSPWSALRSLLRLQSAILTSTSDARDFVGGPKHR